VGDNQRAFLEEVVGHVHALFSNPPGLLRRSSTSPLILFSFKRFRLSVQFAASGFGEAQDLEVGDPRFTQKASSTLARLMSSRVTVKVRLSAEPSRETTILTLVPRCPLSRSAISVVFRPSVGLSSTITMMSPGRKPAL